MIRPAGTSQPAGATGRLRAHAFVPWSNASVVTKIAAKMTVRACLIDQLRARPSDARRIGGRVGEGGRAHPCNEQGRGLTPTTARAKRYAPNRPQRDGRSRRWSMRGARAYGHDRPRLSVIPACL